MSKKRIYIAGCGGMLGEAFYNSFRGKYTLKCTDIDVNEPWLSYADIRDIQGYRKDVEDFRPDYLFHLGALTDLEFCESNPDEAYITNTLAVENATHIANQLNIPLLYISTAGIFDGSKEFYDDWDTPSPLGHYARSKYLGELFVLKHARRPLVCRAGWMMGGGPVKDKKFVSKLMRQLKSEKKEIFVVNDKFGTPTYTNDFANNVKYLLESELWGLYNLVCKGMTSRIEVAQEVLKILQIDSSVVITEVSSEFFLEQYYAPRPVSERLVSRKLDLRNLNVMRDWRICLREYLYSSWRNGTYLQ